jgi:hypothetical protein
MALQETAVFPYPLPMERGASVTGSPFVTSAVCHSPAPTKEFWQTCNSAFGALGLRFFWDLGFGVSLVFLTSVVLLTKEVGS